MAGNDIIATPTDPSNCQSSVELSSSVTGETYSSFVNGDPLDVDSPDEDVHIIIKSEDDPKLTDKPSNGVSSKLSSACAPLLHGNTPLPQNSSLFAKFRHGLLCPPHGICGKTLTYMVAVLTVWGVCFSVFGQVSLPGIKDEHGEVQDLQISIKGGTIFALIVLVVVAYVAGQVVSLVRLPPLLGMLLVGILLKNVPGIDVAKGIDPDWASALRNVALAVILLRAGLGLDPAALRKLSMMVFRLAFCPCLVETLVVAVASYFLLGLPWKWGFMLGFVLAAVSPAVVVPCLLSMQERGFGVAKGIPTLVIAAASVDDVLAISCFTILLGVTFNSDADLASVILQGPLEAFLGLVFGLVWGILVIFLPPSPSPSTVLRVLLLGGGALLALFGSQVAELPGAGALAVLVMAFMAGMGWRNQGWGDDNPVSDVLAALWLVFQPLLFALIGTEIKLAALEGDTVGWGILVLVCGLSFRIVVSYFSVMGGDLNKRERLFVALAWLPKATVQAAIGPTALDYARKALANAQALQAKVAPAVNAFNTSSPAAGGAPSIITDGSVVDDDSDMELLLSRVALGEKVLTIAVLVILITAPIGAIAIMTAGPKLLEKQEKEKGKET